MPTHHPNKTLGPRRVIMIRNADRFDFGGGERVPVDLAVELSKSGYRIVIVSGSDKLLDYTNSRDINNIRGWWWSRQNWSGPKVLLFPLYVVWEILLVGWYVRLFIKLRPGVVHPQSKDDFIAATIAAKIMRAKVIWSDQADLKYIYQNVRIWYKNPIGKLVRLCSRWASAIILTSYNDKSLIANELGGSLSKKYVVIYNGVLDKPSLVDRHHDGSQIVFAATSRLVTEKGIGELIEAFKAVQKDYRAAELWLFGEGSEEAKFKKISAELKGIFFKGFPEDALKQVSNADIFVHPSYLEGFSISVVEATMLGKPIIACSVGGNPEIIVDGKNGLLVPPRDSAELASAMIKLAGNKKLRRQYGKEARRTYEENFALDMIVKEGYIPLYG